MENTSYIALSQQNALQRQMEIIANNIANANTTAFKGERLLFNEFLVRAEPTVDLSYVVDGASVRDQREGGFQRTGNDLDVALDGVGYLVVDTPAGPRYTRNGHLRLDARNQVTTGEGRPVLADNGRPIIIPPNDTKIVIAADGTVSTETGRLAKLDLVRFDNERGLEKVADSLYVANVRPRPATQVKVVQGMVEESNVQPILEITQMIEVLRRYQTAQHLIEGENDRIRKAIDRLPRVNG